MNPIDVDKAGLGFIQPKPAPKDLPLVKEASAEIMAGCRNSNQLLDLLTLIKNTSDTDTAYTAKIEQLRANIHAGKYEVDVDRLASQMMAEDYV